MGDNLCVSHSIASREILALESTVYIFCFENPILKETLTSEFSSETFKL